jgi:hypothetical protein
MQNNNLSEVRLSNILKPIKGVPPELGPTAADSVGQWEKKLKVQALLSWAKNERYHLKVAFDNQRDRVDSEWATFLERVAADYRAQRASIEGKVLQPQQASPSSNQPRKWKTKEKQERLIHTAPVHSPKAMLSVNKELQALDQNYTSTKIQVEAQKKSALCWIQRQSSRMVLQVKAMPTMLLMTMIIVLTYILRLSVLLYLTALCLPG